MERREFLNKAGAATLAAAAVAVKGYVIPWGSMLRRAEADTGIPLTSLKAALDPNECLILLPSDAQYAKYQLAFNLRTALKPQARVLVRSAKGVQQLVQWLKTNKVAFAVRCGGHSYEGFSQSSSVVIDTRLMNKVELDSSGQSVSVGGGAALGEVYAEVGKRGLAIPAGSCPPVGVSGHVQGGGFGELGRPFALACDSVTAIELVDAQGNIRNCTDSENQDLFWALRGGGGGTFGVATRYTFKTHAVPQVVTFLIEWVVPPARAVKIFKAWQQWIVQTPPQITCYMRVTTDHKTGNVTLHAGGESVGAQSMLQAELKKISSEPTSKFAMNATNFLGAVAHFAGGPKQPWPLNEKGNNAYFYDQCYMKGKSDFVYGTTSDEGMLALFSGQQAHPGITAIFDGYGGEIAKIATDATAFFHRKATACVQYVTQFDPIVAKSPTASSVMSDRWASMKAFHDALAPYFKGPGDRRHAYINYPDGDLKDASAFGPAYWGDNYDRLKKIKAVADPDNFFYHSQSVRGE
jgi:FAD/FMN-containing dehydrogenase